MGQERPGQGSKGFWNLAANDGGNKIGVSLSPVWPNGITMLRSGAFRGPGTVPSRSIGVLHHRLRSMHPRPAIARSAAGGTNTERTNKNAAPSKRKRRLV